MWEKNKYNILAVVVVLLLVVVYMSFFNVKDTPPEDYDEFAKCLSDSGAKLYGAYWCSHCNEQKAMFGDSVEHITYIECSLPDAEGQTQECIDAGIELYPTWEFPDGSKVPGVFSFYELSQYTGCPLE